MPAPASSRQPGTSSWFSGHGGQLLLDEERHWLAPRLAARPVQPRLWLAPVPPPEPAVPVPRGVLLYPHGAGYAGSVRCALPWPLPGECMGDVVLQHPPPAQIDALLEESLRLLVAGGRLWLCAFNPCGPFRLRGRGAHWAAPLAQDWQWRLHRLGLQSVEPVRFVGPRWRLRGDGRDAGSALSLRAACVLQAEKRVAAPVAPAAVHWRHGAAPAA
ncbi:hypothetical protein CSC62_02770 [Pseudoxanthomonas jiangsuensis]|uniref:hypothetical protein n=1 Tax=Pseudoxanthomonas jiangsuensis TaxID=619688 RepID=UPI0013918033|nr:hypothetical protein [Pseudoxanthomonas jiangsuensis]KAF1698885.1 hypothetical protein CSC62_02770 [Pseudoxanthomonas jiangsuensis]